MKYNKCIRFIKINNEKSYSETLQNCNTTDPVTLNGKVRR